MKRYEVLKNLRLISKVAKTVVSDFKDGNEDDAYDALNDIVNIANEILEDDE